MLNDIKDSIKAKLYDFTYTPFMSSVLISWVIINHKYLLIYFSDFDLDKKLPLLVNHDFAFHCYGYYLPYANNFFFPILFGLFYVYVYPKISKEFYGYTLNRTKELKGIKQAIEDETPLTQAEAREIRKLASTLEEEKDKALRILSKKDEEWQLKLDNALGDMNVKIAELNSDVIASNVLISDLETERNTLQKERENIQTQLTQSNQFLESKNDECEQLKVENEQLKKQHIPSAVIPVKKVIKSGTKSTLQMSDSYKKVMQYLHDYFDEIPESNLLNDISNHANIGRTVTRQILNTLIDENILINVDGTIKMTKDGADKVVSFVDSLSEEIPF